MIWNIFNRLNYQEFSIEKLVDTKTSLITFDILLIYTTNFISIAGALIINGIKNEFAPHLLLSNFSFTPSRYVSKALYRLIYSWDEFIPFKLDNSCI